MSGQDETTQLPEDLQKFFLVTLGMKWPEGNEGGLWAISDGLLRYSEDTQAAADVIQRAISDVDTALDGETADETLNFMRTEIYDKLVAASEGAAELASSAKDTAADIQKTKIMFIAMTAMTMATVVSLLASLFGSAAVPGVLASARVAITQGMRQLVQKVAQNVSKRVAVPKPGWLGAVGSRMSAFGASRAGQIAGMLWRPLKRPVIGAAAGAGIMAGLDGFIQIGQKNAGTRDEYDPESVKNMAIGGAIGGAAVGAASGAFRGIANKIPNGFKGKFSGDFRKRFGNLTHAGMGMGAIAASNPGVQKATGAEDGHIYDGIIGGAARAPKKGGGEAGPATEKLANLGDFTFDGPSLTSDGPGGGRGIESGPDGDAGKSESGTLDSSRRGQDGGSSNSFSEPSNQETSNSGPGGTQFERGSDGSSSDGTQTERNSGDSGWDGTQFERESDGSSSGGTQTERNFEPPDPDGTRTTSPDSSDSTGDGTRDGSTSDRGFGGRESVPEVVSQEVNSRGETLGSMFTPSSHHGFPHQPGGVHLDGTVVEHDAGPPPTESHREAPPREQDTDGPAAFWLDSSDNMETGSGRGGESVGSDAVPTPPDPGESFVTPGSDQTPQTIGGPDGRSDSGSPDSFAPRDSTVDSWSQDESGRDGSGLDRTESTSNPTPPPESTVESGSQERSGLDESTPDQSSGTSVPPSTPFGAGSPDSVAPPPGTGSSAPGGSGTPGQAPPATTPNTGSTGSTGGTSTPPVTTSSGPASGTGAATSSASQTPSDFRPRTSSGDGIGGPKPGIESTPRTAGQGGNASPPRTAFSTSGPNEGHVSRSPNVDGRGSSMQSFLGGRFGAAPMDGATSHPETSASGAGRDLAHGQQNGRTPEATPPSTGRDGASGANQGDRASNNGKRMQDQGVQTESYVAPWPEHRGFGPRQDSGSHTPTARQEQGPRAGQDASVQVPEPFGSRLRGEEQRGFTLPGNAPPVIKPGANEIVLDPNVRADRLNELERNEIPRQRSTVQQLSDALADHQRVLNEWRTELEGKPDAFQRFVEHHTAELAAKQRLLDQARASQQRRQEEFEHSAVEQRADRKRILDSAREATEWFDRDLHQATDNAQAREVELRNDMASHEQRLSGLEREITRLQKGMSLAEQELTRLNAQAEELRKPPILWRELWHPLSHWESNKVFDSLYGHLNALNSMEARFGKQDHGRNCVNVVVSTINHLSGEPMKPFGVGTPRQGWELEAHFGETVRFMTPQQMADQLISMGPGAQGIVFEMPKQPESEMEKPPPGHVFNAYYDPRLDAISFIDAQFGKFGSFDTANKPYAFMPVPGTGTPKPSATPPDAHSATSPGDPMDVDSTGDGFGRGGKPDGSTPFGGNALSRSTIPEQSSPSDFASRRSRGDSGPDGESIPLADLPSERTNAGQSESGRGDRDSAPTNQEPHSPGTDQNPNQSVIGEGSGRGESSRGGESSRNEEVRSETRSGKPEEHQAQQERRTADEPRPTAGERVGEVTRSRSEAAANRNEVGKPDSSALGEDGGRGAGGGRSAHDGQHGSAGRRDAERDQGDADAGRGDDGGRSTNDGRQDGASRQDTEGRQDNEGSHRGEDDQARSDSTSRPERTAEQIRDALPDYLREGQTLHPAEQIGAARHPDAPDGKPTGVDALAQLDRLLPNAPGKWSDVSGLQHQLDHNVSRFVGEDGYTVTVHKGSSKYELTVTAKPQWERMEVIKPSESPLSTSGKKKITRDDGTASSRDKSFNPVLANTSFPGMMILSNPSVPLGMSEATQGTSGRVFRRSDKFEVPAPYDVTVPVKFEFSLRNSDGRPVAPAGTERPSQYHVADTANVPLRVPMTLGTDGPSIGNALAKERARDFSGRFNDEQRARISEQGIREINRQDRTGTPGGDSAPHAVTLHPDLGSPGFVEQVRNILGERFQKATEFGSDGREALRNFLSQENIKAKLPSMAVFDNASPHEGWVKSPPIHRSGPSRIGPMKSTMLEMRAVAKWIKVGDAHPDASHTHSQSNTNKDIQAHQNTRSGGFTATAGPALDSGLITGVAGPTGGASRTVGHTQEVTSSTKATEDIQRTGDTGRYQLAYELQVRQLGGEQPTTLKGLVGADYLGDRSTLVNSGLLDDSPHQSRSHEFRSGDDRTHFGPEQFERGKAIFGQFEEFSTGNWFRDEISSMLRDLPLSGKWRLNGKEFVRQFDDPEFAKGLSAKVADILDRRDKLANALNDAEIAHLMRRVLDDALYIPVKHESKVHDRTTIIRLSANLNNIRDGELTRLGDDRSGQQGSGSAKPEAKKSKITTENRFKDSDTAKTGKARSWTATVGAQGRIYKKLGLGTNIALFGWRSDITRTKEHLAEITREDVWTGKRGDSLDSQGELGNHGYRQFRADIEIKADVLSYSRLSKGMRGLIPQAPGRDVPRFESHTSGFPLELEQHERGPERSGEQVASLTRKVDARLLIPENLVSTENPVPGISGEGHDGQASAPKSMENPPSPREMPPGSTHKLDGAPMRGFSGGSTLRRMAVNLLNKVTDNDPIVRFPVSEINGPLSELVAADRIENDPSRFSRPTTTSISYQRARHDLAIELGMSLKPKLDDTPVTRAEYERMSRELAASSKSSDSRGWNFVHGGYVGTVFNGGFEPSKAGGNTVEGFGLGVVNVTPVGHTHGTGHGHGLSGGERLTVETPPEKRYLARVKVEASMVAEAVYKGNIDRFELFKRPEPTRSGEVVELPESQLMWLTEEQLAELRSNSFEDAPAPRDDGSVSRDDAAASRDDASGSRGDATASRESSPASRDDAAASRDDALDSRSDARSSRENGSVAREDGSAPRHSALEMPTSLELEHTTKPSPGLGGVIEPIDLSGQLRNIRSRLSEDFGEDVANGLLPDTAAGSPHHNQRVMNTLLDRVNNALTDVINGGERTQLRLERRFNGHTYRFTLDADFVPHKSGRIEHVDKLKLSHQSTPSREHKTSRGWKYLTTTVTGRLAGRATESAPSGEKPATGVAGTGLTGEATATSRTSRTTESYERGHDRSAETSGPVGRYDGHLELRLKVEHDTHTSTVDMWHPVSVTKSLEDLLPEPKGKYGESEEPIRLSEEQRTPEALEQWRDEGFTMPSEGFFSEHYFGDVNALRDTARQTIVDSNAKITKSVTNDLDNALTASQLRAALPEMLRGEFKVPLPQINRLLEVHARIPETPKFGNTSNTVSISDVGKVKDSKTSELVNEHAGSLKTTAPWTTVGNAHPEGAKRDAMEQHSGFVARENTTMTSRDAGKLTQKGESYAYETDRKPSTVHHEKMTRSLLADVEFRFVVRDHGAVLPHPDGGREMRVNDGYVPRLRDEDAATRTGHHISPELTEATKKLGEKGKAWSEATKRLVAAKEHGSNLEAARKQEKTAAQEWHKAREAWEQLTRGEQPSTFGLPGIPAVSWELLTQFDEQLGKHGADEPGPSTNKPRGQSPDEHGPVDAGVPPTGPGPEASGSGGTVSGQTGPDSSRNTDDSATSQPRPERASQEDGGPESPGQEAVNSEARPKTGDSSVSVGSHQTPKTVDVPGEHSGESRSVTGVEKRDMSLSSFLSGESEASRPSPSPNGGPEASTPADNAGTDERGTSNASTSTLSSGRAEDSGTNGSGRDTQQPRPKGTMRDQGTQTDAGRAPWPENKGFGPRQDSGTPTPEGRQDQGTQAGHDKATQAPEPFGSRTNDAELRELAPPEDAPSVITVGTNEVILDPRLRTERLNDLQRNEILRQQSTLRQLNDEIAAHRQRLDGARAEQEGTNDANPAGNGRRDEPATPQQRVRDTEQEIARLQQQANQAKQELGRLNGLADELRNPPVLRQELWPTGSREPETMFQKLYGELDAGDPRESTIDPQSHQQNCINVAVSTVNHLAGDPMKPFDSSAPRYARDLENHFGGSARSATPGQIVNELTRMGPGAQGIVFETPKSRPNQQEPSPGHVFNAYYDPRLGAISFLDVQSGKFGSFDTVHNDYAFMPIPETGTARSGETTPPTGDNAPPQSAGTPVDPGAAFGTGRGHPNYGGNGYYGADWSAYQGGYGQFSYQGGYGYPAFPGGYGYPANPGGYGFPAHPGDFGHPTHQDHGHSLNPGETPYPQHRNKRLIMQPSYASGDQFGIAAALINDPDMHVVIGRSTDGHLGPVLDKSAAIRRFYRDSGIESSRIHFADIGPGQRQWDGLNHRGYEIARYEWGMQADHLRGTVLLNNEAGTEYVATSYSEQARMNVREAWGLNDHRTDGAIRQWLHHRGVNLPGHDGRVLVLWSRFSGKTYEWETLRGRMENDTSFEGMRQILRGVGKEYDAVLIAGDNHPTNPGKMADFVAEMRRHLGGKVHDVTEFWHDQSTAHWGGQNRTTQYRLYDYLDRHHQLKHLGFRSGNLEAVALIGHDVRYLEEHHARGGARMTQWHDAGNGRTIEGGMAPGYERIETDSPATRSGKLSKQVQDDFGEQEAAYRYANGRKPIEAYVEESGFSYRDLRQITDYLTDGDRRSLDRTTFELDRLEHRREQLSRLRRQIRSNPAILGELRAERNKALRVVEHALVLIDNGLRHFEERRRVRPEEIENLDHQLNQLLGWFWQ